MHNTMNEQLSAQIDYLMSFLDNFEQRKQRAIEEIRSAVLSAQCWRECDYETFANSSFWLSEVEKQPALFQLRNEKWLPKLLAAMSEAPTMFVFGAGHLIGTYGMLQLLRNAGYTVEQIKKR